MVGSIASQGYVVMTDDKVLYALNTTDDLKYLREADELYFSVYDGFMYLDESGDFSSYNEEEDSLSLIGSLSKANNKATAVPCAQEGILSTDLDQHMKMYYPDYILSTSIEKLIYVKESDLGAIGTKHYLRIYVIADGHSYTYKYYDPNTDGNPNMQFIYLKSTSPSVPRC